MGKKRKKGKDGRRRSKKYKDKLEKPIVGAVHHTAIKHICYEAKNRLMSVEPCLYDMITRFTASGLGKSLETVNLAKAIYLIRKFYSGEDVSERCIRYFNDSEFCLLFLDFIEYLFKTCCSYWESYEDGIYSYLFVYPSRVLQSSVMSSLEVY